MITIFYNVLTTMRHVCLNLRHVITMMRLGDHLLTLYFSRSCGNNISHRDDKLSWLTFQHLFNPFCDSCKIFNLLENGD